MINKNKGRKRVKDYKEQIIRDLGKRRLKKIIQIGVSGNTLLGKRTGSEYCIDIISLSTLVLKLQILLLLDCKNMILLSKCRCL